MRRTTAQLSAERHRTLSPLSVDIPVFQRWQNRFCGASGSSTTTNSEHEPLMEDDSGEVSPTTHRPVGADTGDGLTNVTPRRKQTSRRPNTEGRREQCRRNQERYRERQRDYASQLEVSVTQLRREVDQLQSLRDRIFCADAAVRTVVEYYRMFCHGLLDHRVNEQSASQQVAFLRSAIARDVSMGDLRGREWFLDQLRLWATVYGGFAMHLHHMEAIRGPDGTTVVHEVAHSELTISSRTIRYVIPHLLQGGHHQIQSKLLGVRLTSPSWGFHICDAGGRIVHIAWSIDWVAALQRLLTLEEIAIVLGQAQISRDAYLMLE
jgi:hypothetical protein